ncbi:hypothetical protein LP415_02095 [Polaromonas sp. P1(28)-8]|nr:hypothetical protein LP415_02095 [Polaromonas sp. P1(28)-8]
MATRDTRSSSRFSEARASEQARVEDAAHVGGMAGAFSPRVRHGPAGAGVAAGAAGRDGAVTAAGGRATGGAARHRR